MCLSCDDYANGVDAGVLSTFCRLDLVDCNELIEELIDVIREREGVVVDVVVVVVQIDIR